MSGYSPLNGIHDPATGNVAPAAWGDQVHLNLEALIDPPACSISAAAKTVNSGTLTVLGDSPAATENYDNDAMHSTGSNQSRITIQTAGRYLFLGNVFTDSFTGTLNAFVRISFRVDGTTAVGGSQIKNSTAAEAVRLNVARSLVLTAGQYVEMTMQHSLGGSVQATLDELVAIFLTR